MRRAIEKLADREAPVGCRDVVCHRCGTRCAVATGARLDETACIGCLRPLTAARDEYGHSVRALAGWWDKATAPGPGYGIVACPHCATSCVVEVGGAARTACVGCLRALGSAPLIRMDLTPSDGAERLDRTDALMSGGRRAVLSAIRERVEQWRVHRRQVRRLEEIFG